MDDDLLFLLGGLNPKSRSAVIENMRDLCLGFNDAWKEVLERNKKNELKIVFQAAIYLLEQQQDDKFRKGKNAALRILLLVDFSPLLQQQLQLHSRLVNALLCELAKPGSVDKEMFAKNQLSCDLACEVLITVYYHTSNAPASPDMMVQLCTAVGAYCSNEKSPLHLRLVLVERLSVGNPALSTHIVATKPALAALLQGFVLELECKVPGTTAHRALINVTNQLPNARDLAVRLVPLAQDKLQVLFHNQGDRSTWEFDEILLLLTLLANLVELPENRVFELINTKLMCDLFHISLPLRIANDLVNGSSSDTIEFTWTPEELVLSSHICLVLGCLVRDSDNTKLLSDMLPGGKKRGFAPQIQILQAFLEFQRQAQVVTPEMQDSVNKVASYFIVANQRLMLPPLPRRG